MTIRTSGSPGRPFIGRLNEKSSIHATSRLREGESLVRCPVCKEMVATRAKGTVIANHRVGSSTKNSWPCAGSNGLAPHNEE